MPRLEPGQFGIEELRDRAVKYPRNEPVSAVAFVTSEIRNPRTPQPSDIRAARGFINGKIGFWPLLGMATEWDEMGMTTLSEFLDAVECETSGTQRGEEVRRVETELTVRGLVQQREEQEFQEDNEGYFL